MLKYLFFSLVLTHLIVCRHCNGADFAYTERTLIVTNEFNKLFAILSTPKETNKFPGVLLIAGSGPVNHDSQFGSYRPFKDLTDFFSKLGFAVLRYDKRGVGQSSGCYNTANIFDFCSDAQAMFDEMKHISNIDTNRLLIVGHSEGAMIAEILSSDKNNDVAGAILLNGPALPGREFMLNQALTIAKSDSCNPFEMNVISNFINSTIVILSDTINNIEAEKEINIIRERTISILSSNQAVAINNSITLNTQGITTRWTRTFITFDPKSYFQDIHCPILAIFGESDEFVDAKENSSVIKSIAGSNTAIKIIPRLNHYLQNDNLSSVSTSVSLVLLHNINSWLQQE